MDYYSGIASGYDELYGLEQREKLGEFLSRVPVREGSLLDVGCATGWTHDLFPGVRWQGLEPSEGLIEQALPVVRKKIVCAPAEQMPFPDNMFNTILCLTVLQNVQDAGQVLREMRRVCRGTLLVSFLKKSGQSGKLDEDIRTILTVEQHWEGEKDMMYVCRS